MRFFFHVDDGHPQPDTEGVEFPDAASARIQAIRTCGEMIRDLEGRLFRNAWRMDVTDEAGERVLSAKFVVEVDGPG